MKNENQGIRKLIQLHQQISQEEIAKYWTLSDNDKRELMQYRRNYKLFIGIQLCAVRLYGRFFTKF